MAQHLPLLLLVLFTATLAPLLAEIPPRLRVPSVLIEILLGILIGPSVLGWVAPNDVTLVLLSNFGLGMLFFLIGLEIDLTRIAGPPLRSAGACWGASFLIGLAIAAALEAAGIIDHVLLVAVAFSTTTLGTLLPLLREAERVDASFRTAVLAHGAAGELGPILMISLALKTSGSELDAAAAFAAFAVVAVAIGLAAGRVSSGAVAAFLQRYLHRVSQLPIRTALLLLVALAAVCSVLGLQLILGAFAAGLVVGIITRDADAAPFLQKFDALGFGFLVPIFFIMSGVRYDLTALRSSLTGVPEIPIFLACFFLARGVPILFAHRQLARRQRLALALLNSTALSLVVAIVTIGLAANELLPETGAALMGAAMLSVLVFPILAMAALGGREAGIGDRGSGTGGQGSGIGARGNAGYARDSG